MWRAKFTMFVLRLESCARMGPMGLVARGLGVARAIEDPTHWPPLLSLGSGRRLLAGASSYLRDGEGDSGAGEFSYVFRTYTEDDENSLNLQGLLGDPFHTSGMPDADLIDDESPQIVPNVITATSATAASPDAATHGPLEGLRVDEKLSQALAPLQMGADSARMSLPPVITGGGRVRPLPEFATDMVAAGKGLVDGAVKGAEGLRMVKGHEMTTADRGENDQAAAESEGTRASPSGTRASSCENASPRATDT